MESPAAVTALSALAHASRLEVFRLLVRAGPDGMAAGEIARATDSLPNTLSANLNILAGAGLVEGLANAVQRHLPRAAVRTAHRHRIATHCACA